MIDRLLPRSDQAAIAQAVVVLVLGATAFVALQQRREARIFAAGITILLLAAMGLRVIH